MGCGGGINDIFRVYGNSCNNRGNRSNSYQSNDYQEKISLIKSMYAEGKISRDEYYSLKDKVYNHRVSFEELIDIKESNTKVVQKKEHISINKNTEINKFQEKKNELEDSKLRVEAIHNKIEEKLQELIGEKKKMQSIAESMVSASENSAREFIEKKLDLEENIQTLVKRKQSLVEEIGELEKTIKLVETKILDYEAVKLQEEISKLKEEL